MSRTYGSKNKINSLRVAQQQFEQTMNVIKEQKLLNQTIRANEYLNNLKSKGDGAGEKTWEGEGIFGYPYSPFPNGNLYNLMGIDAGIGINSFPRELYPDRPTSLRSPIAHDIVRLESRIFYERSPNYSGLINHLRNFIIGKGMDIKCASLTDDDNTELCKDIIDYLEEFANYKCNKLYKRVYDSVLNYYRDGDDFIRLFPSLTDLPEIRNVDSSTVRGPHQEITGPWSYGILTNWPRDYEEVLAYHVWFSDNSSENVSPYLMKHLKAETIGANVKRGSPLSFKIRKQLEQIINLSDCCAIGESARQSIPYIIQYQLQQAGSVQASINARAIQPTFSSIQPTETNTSIKAGEVRHIGPGKDFKDPPSTDNTGTWVYEMLCQEIATAIGSPEWLVSGTSNNTNFSSSLVAESPLVKNIEHTQDNVSEYYQDILKSVIEIGMIQGKFPPNTLELVQISCKFPSPISRDKLEDVKSNLLLLNEECLDPQTFCSEHGLDFDKVTKNIAQAKALGWKSSEETARSLATDVPIDVDKAKIEKV
jgi:hypothetical protein